MNKKGTSFFMKIKNIRMFLKFSLLTILIVILLLSCSQKDNPLSLDDFKKVAIEANYKPQTKICIWKDNKKAAYTITFDDPRSSHYMISSTELEKRNMVGTFNLNTKGIVNWNCWQTLYNNGHEIASHSWSHPDFTLISESVQKQELEKAISDILTNISNISDVPSFAYPYGHFDDVSIKNVLKYHLSGRGAKKGINSNNLAENEFGKLKAIWVTLPYDMDVYYDYVLEAIKEGGWGMYIFHSVNKNGDLGSNDIPIELFRQHLDSVNNLRDSLWIATQEQVVKYIKIRQTNKITCKVVNHEIVEVTLEDKLKFQNNNTELTFTLNLPSEWMGKYVVIEDEKTHSIQKKLAPESIGLFDILPGSKLRICGVE